MEDRNETTVEMLRRNRIEQGRTLITQLKGCQEVHLGKTYKIFLEEWFWPDWTSDQKFIGTPIYASIKAVQFEIEGEKRWFPKTAIRKVEEVE